MKTIAILLTLLILGGCQTPIHTGSQCVVGPGYISDETSFTWRLDEVVDLDDATGYVSPLAVVEIESAVKKELDSKGLSFVERNLDFVDDQWSDVEIALTLRTRRELVSIDVNQPVCDDADCWDRIDTGSQTRMDIRTVGFLAADVYYQNEPIWRGWVETYLYPKDRDAAAEVVARAVPKLFETFPP